MRPDRRFLGIGLFLIALGAVLLGVRQGLIPIDVARRAWQLWPVLLVAAGLSLLLARRPAAGVGTLVAAVTLGAMVGGLIGSGSGFPFVGCGGRDDATETSHQSGDLGSTARVNIDFHCGDLSVATGPGSSWSVDASSADGREPSIRESSDELEIEASSTDGLFGISATREQWDIVLPSEPTIDLDLTLNAGSGRVELGGAHLAEVDMTVNAGSLVLDLRDAAAARDLDGTVNAGSAVVWLPDLPLEGGVTVNAGSLNLCSSEVVGLRLVTAGGALSSNDFDDRGLVERDGAWETPGFATAEIRITLDVQANAGSMSLNNPDDCTS